MYSPNRPEPDLPPWLRTGMTWVWKRRRTIGQNLLLLIVVAANVGVLAYHFSPTDLERAESDIKRARATIEALEAESDRELEDAIGHRKRATVLQKHVDENRDTADLVCLEWCKSSAHAESKLNRAKRARRDNLLHLAGEYRRLLAEAECELLRAKDARDRGTPYKVAPRVREILTPALASQ